MKGSVQSFVEGPLKAAPTSALRALWHAANNDWHNAHEQAQADNSADGAWVHALLHREEGDALNAGYWYKKAGKPVCTLTVEQEREQITLALLAAANSGKNK